MTEGQERRLTRPVGYRPAHTITTAFDLEERDVGYLSGSDRIMVWTGLTMLNVALHLMFPVDARHHWVAKSLGQESETTVIASPIRSAKWQLVRLDVSLRPAKDDQQSRVSQDIWVCLGGNSEPSTSRS